MAVARKLARGRSPPDPPPELNYPMAAPQYPSRSSKVTYRGEVECHGSQARTRPLSHEQPTRAHSVLIRSTTSLRSGL
jgi:hypothetical protein